MDWDRRRDRRERANEDVLANDVNCATTTKRTNIGRAVISLRSGRETRRVTITYVGVDANDTAKNGGVTQGTGGCVDPVGVIKFFIYIPVAPTASVTARFAS